MKLELTEAEYLELRVAALLRIDLLTRALSDGAFSYETQKRHQKDLEDITSAYKKLEPAYFAAMVVA